jgi:hypothetical protein
MTEWLKVMDCKSTNPNTIIVERESPTNSEPLELKALYAATGKVYIGPNNDNYKYF